VAARRAAPGRHYLEGRSISPAASFIFLFHLIHKRVNLFIIAQALFAEKASRRYASSDWAFLPYVLLLLLSVWLALRLGNGNAYFDQTVLYGACHG